MQSKLLPAAYITPRGWLYRQTAAVSGRRRTKAKQPTTTCRRVEPFGANCLPDGFSSVSWLSPSMNKTPRYSARDMAAMFRSLGGQVCESYLTSRRHSCSQYSKQCVIFYTVTLLILLLWKNHWLSKLL